LNKLLTLIAFSILLLVPAAAQDAFAVLLSDLLAGQSIVFGDKEFTNFRNFQSNAQGPNAVPADPTLINVVPKTSGGEVGLIFFSGLNDPLQSTFLVGDFSGQGTTFEFDVLVQDPNFRISDNTLAITNFGLIGVVAKVSVEERVEDTLGNELAFKEAFLQLGGPNQQTDHKVFQPQSQVTVNIDVGLIGDTLATSGSARLSAFDVLFSQTDLTPSQGVAVGGEIIPLDSTMVLAAGAQYTAAWMIPVLVSAIGIGIVFARKF